MDWLHLPEDEASLPKDEASLPTDEASPIGPFFFSLLFFSFLKYFLFVCSGSFTIRISVKNRFFLRTHVDLLNYPLNSCIDSVSHPSPPQGFLAPPLRNR